MLFLLLQNIDIFTRYLVFASDRIWTNIRLVESQSDCGIAHMQQLAM